MDRLEFPAGRGNTVGTGGTGGGGATRIRLSESVERLALQTSRSGTAESTGRARSLRRHALSGGGGIIERLYLFPTLLRALEEDGLTIVSGGDEGGFGGERERSVGQGGGSDHLDSRGRLAGRARVDDANRRVVAWRRLAQ